MPAPLASKLQAAAKAGKPSARPLRAALLAHPAGHSLSPAMHTAALAWAGLGGSYHAEDVPPEKLAVRLAQFRAQASRHPQMCWGLNLSLPHKVAVLDWLDELTPEAEAASAVNTVRVKRPRTGAKGQKTETVRLVGHNTDAAGLGAALGQAGFAGLAVGEKAVLLGAGGAARAALYCLREQQQRLIGETERATVLVVNRTVTKAQALAAAFDSPRLRVDAVSQANLADIDWAHVGLVINATSVGLGGEQASALPLSAAQWAQLPAHAVVYDMVYGPAPTPLLRQARAAGLRAEGGLSMLAAQGALAFAYWTGVTVPASVLEQAAYQTMQLAAKQGQGQRQQQGQRSHGRQPQ